MNFRRKTLGGIATTTIVGPADGASATYAITGQACNLWTGVLTDALVPQINQYLTHLFDLAVEEGKQLGKADRKSIYGIFQRNCIAVKDIAVTELDNRIKTLESKVKNLQRVIITVLKLTFSVMSVSRTNNLSQVKIKPIDRRDFVKQCYQSSAYEVGVRYPHWFDKGLDFAKRQEYFYQAQVAIGAAITHVILENIPHELISAKPQQNPDELSDVKPVKTVRHKAPSLLVPVVTREKGNIKKSTRRKQEENTNKIDDRVPIRKPKQSISQKDVKSDVHSDVPPDRMLPTMSDERIVSPQRNSGGSKTVTPNSKHAGLSPFSNNSHRDKSYDKTLANKHDGSTTGTSEKRPTLPDNPTLSVKPTSSDRNFANENDTSGNASMVRNSVQGKQSTSQSKQDESKSITTAPPSKTLSATKTNMTPVAISVAPTGSTGNNKNSEPPQILLMPNTLANNNDLARSSQVAARVGTPLPTGKVGTPVRGSVTTADGPASAQSSVNPTSSVGTNTRDSSPLDSKSSALETDIQRSIKHVQNMMKNNPENDDDFDEDFEVEATPADLEHHSKDQDDGEEDDDQEEEGENDQDEE